MKNLIVLFFVVLGFGGSLWAQTTKNRPLRVELETAKDANDFNFIEVGEQGIFVFYESAMTGKDSTTWIFIHYDTNLQRKATMQIVTQSRLAYSYVCASKSHVFVLLQDMSGNKNSGVMRVVIRVNIWDNSMEIYEIGILPYLLVRDMKPVDENHLLLLLSGEKYDEVFYVDFFDSQIFRFDMPEKSVSAVNFIMVDTVQEQILLGMVTEKDKQSCFGLYVTDIHGNIKDIQYFPAIKDVFYNNAQLTIIDSATYLIIGTYSVFETKFSSNVHSGVYSLRYRNGSFEQPDFFQYTDLKAENVNGSKSVSTTEALSSTNLYTLASPLFVDSMRILFLTEFYYPEYTTTTTYNHYDPYSYYSRTPTYTNTFSGYRYVNAYITTFDTAGNLTWHYYFPFQNLITYRLMQRLNACFLGDETLLYYPFNTYITATLLHEAATIVPLTTINLETNYLRDAVEYSRDARITHWYGNNFLCSGYQYIRNGTKGVKSKRYVFYLNKLRYE